MDTPTRAQWVYEQLKEAILSGALKPGERLIVDQLARDFGTSPIPVREAIRRLEAEELVETKPYIGARVAPVRADQLEELMAIRKALEPLLARTAVEGATPEAIEELADLVERMNATQDNLEYSRLNYEFHRKLYSLSPWTLTLRIVHTVWDLSARTRFVFLQAPEYVELSQAEHRAMVDALRRRDGQELERLVRTQKERAFDLFRRRIEKSSDDGSPSEHS
ncbi:MAG: GntR family transcriptional regulator [Firmicutes bacterium]|nr:GntR family transcriptional regulator [Bacillota bacterium]